MVITKLAVDGFKNLKNVEIFPHEKLNIFCGRNAQGKTNLIESIWLCTGVKSFRSTKDKNMNAERAVQILERYIREHKNGKKEEERDVSSALAYLLENGLVDKNIMNLNIAEETPDKDTVITDREEK